MKNDSTLAQGKGTQALVIGGGIAGLLTARVLSDYYEQILVVDRDVFPEQPQLRAGTPQAFHSHRMLPRGNMILERLFPDYIDELLAEGGYPVQNKESIITTPHGSLVMRQPGKGVSCSRALLEWDLRRRVQALPNVRFLPSQEVIGLEVSPDRDRITGVLLRERGHLERQTTITAELVIDASGRSSKLASWLQELGYTLPETGQVRGDLGYSTRHYQAPPDFAGNWSVIMAEGSPSKGTFTAALSPKENNILHLLVWGAGGHYPPTDADQFEEALTHLNSPDLTDALQGAEPLGPPRGYRIPVCIRQHYEQMEDWPTGLLAIGDAFCHFDPVYGQGMTVAAMEAETLATCLREQQSHPQAHFERRTLQRMQEATYSAWWLSAIADLRWSGVTYVGQEPPQGIELVHTYLDLYLDYATEHPLEPASNGKPDLSSPQPTRVKYFLMNGQVIPPQVVFNATTFALLLEAEASSEEPQRLHELTQDYHLPLAEVLAEVLPSFSLAFEAPAALAAA